MRIDTGVQKYQCCHCDNCFTKKGSLGKHPRINNKDKLYQCSHAIFFVYNSYRIRHQKIHTQKKPYQCSHGGKLFAHNRDLITHQIIHTRDKPYQCSHCDKNLLVKLNWKKYIVNTLRIIHNNTAIVQQIWAMRQKGLTIIKYTNIPLVYSSTRYWFFKYKKIN